MLHAPDSPYRVPFDGTFKQAEAATSPDRQAADKKELTRQLRECVKKLDDLQRRLYADNRHSVLLIFQGMDAAGKDGTIRAVLKGINPAGCQVFSFKQPSQEELDHDFMWRTNRRLPERGRIGVFNRSYYEEVLVVKVHPEYLVSQKLEPVNHDAIWQERYESVRQHEQHLARNGTVILKFWLNVSKAEQRKRFLKRLNEPEKNWKFSSGDIQERAHWDDYMKAFESAVSETSRPWAPWYAIPADNKAYMRVCVVDIVMRAMASLNPRYPELDDKERKRFDEMRKILG